MDIIDRLKKVELPMTEITSVTYEEGGTFQNWRGVEAEVENSYYRVCLCGRYGEGSFVRTEVWLPVEWNGILLSLGNGGIAGNIDSYGLSLNVKKGYAVVNTDMGTSRGRDSGINNPDVWKDFGWRSTHEMTVAAKAFVKEMYGRDAEYSYYYGASTGGQQGFSAAQRFPEDYDGIFCGVPANNRTQLHTYFLWNHLLLRQENTPIFTHEDVEMISALAVEYYQSRGDGEKGDAFVSCPIQSAEVIDGFVDYLKEKTSFSEKQLDALRKVYYGPQNPRTGKMIYNGMPIGSEKYPCGIEECAQEESPHYYPFIWTFGKDYTGEDFDFDKDMDKVNATLAEDLNANSPDLSEFKKNGGKVLMYSGSADPCVPFPDAIKYYDRITEAMGGLDNTKDFCRYFLLPGKEHGALGAGVNAVWENKDGGDELTILRRWREEGIAPDVIMGVSFIDNDSEKGVEFIRELPYYGSKEDKIPKLDKEEFLVCDDVYL